MTKVYRNGHEGTFQNCIYPTATLMLRRRHHLDQANLLLHEIGDSLWPFTRRVDVARCARSEAGGACADTTRLKKGWRREWDSNPRYAYTHTRFPSVRLQPLGHLSRATRSTTSGVHLQRGKERALRNFNLAELAHPLLALFLLVQQLALAADVAAIALSRHVL